MFDELLKLLDAGYEVTFVPNSRVRAIGLQIVSALDPERPDDERLHYGTYVCKTLITQAIDAESLFTIELSRASRDLAKLKRKLEGTDYGET